MLMLFDILSDLMQIDDLLLIIKDNGAVAEIRSNDLKIRQKEKWITIGDNDGPAHMHINSELIKKAEFVQEEKKEKTTFSVRFFDQNEHRILGVFFTKMYDQNKKIKFERKKIFENLRKKYGFKILF
jgi:putative heme iron utilization protein